MEWLNSHITLSERDDQDLKIVGYFAITINSITYLKVTHSFDL